MTARLKRALIICVGVLVASVMVLLGLWQMDVFRSEGRQSIEQRAAAPARPLDEVTDGTKVGDGYGRQVTITGTYVTGKEIYVGSTYPMRVLTALRTTDGRIVAVVRGTIAGPNDKVPAPPTGEVTQTGLLLPTEKDAGREVLPAQDLKQPRLLTVRVPKLAQVWPTPLLNGFVTLNAEDAAAHGLEPAEVTLPEGEGSQRNAGYALQWWAFAVAAVAGSIAISRSVKDVPRA